MHPLSARTVVALTAFAALALAPGTARAADDRGVARIALLHGNVDVVRADSGDTVAAAVNEPLAVGDELVSHDGARAEVELDYGTLVRIAPDTQMRFTRLGRHNHVAQLALGSVEVRVFHDAGIAANVESPQATLRPRSVGSYRATVASDGGTTFATRVGSADVTSESGTQTLAGGEELAVTGSFAAPYLHDIGGYASDAFDRWADARDVAIAREHESAYVNADLVGADDLDSYGRWIDNPRYGRVWSPYEAAGWSPYHDGRFVWEPYYGWTWVAAEPWGWAPYHYGNWFYANDAWCWYPGAYGFAQPYVYRPAVVAFFSFGGGSGLGFGFANVGWVPLAPFEPFSPWYGPGYRNVTVVNTITNITNVTNITNAASSGNLTYTIYHNVSAPGGIVALRRSDFASGHFARVDIVRPVALSHANVLHGMLPIVPTANNLAPTNAAPRTLAPAGLAFAHFAPPATPVRAFALERARVAEVGHAQSHVVPPLREAAGPRRSFERSAPIVTYGANFARPGFVVPRGTTATSEPASQRLAHPTVLVMPTRRATTHALEIRPSSPWDRFAGRSTSAVMPRSEPGGHAPREIPMRPREAGEYDARPMQSQALPATRIPAPALPTRAFPSHAANPTLHDIRETHVVRERSDIHPSVHAH